MMLARGFIVLAVVAALWGAPSSVSAAVNELSAAQVSPQTGSVTTVFTFRVRYDGGFPAGSVSVAVAGLTLPMALESGSLTAGWWTATSLLPLGAWSTSFGALAPQGPSPTLAGPAVTVAGLATPYPTASLPSAPGGGQTPASAPAGEAGTPAPSAAPAPAPAEAAASGTATSTPAPDASDANLAPGASDGAGGPSAGATMATPPPADPGGAGAPAGGTSDAGGGSGEGTSDTGGESEPAAGAPVASPATELQASGGGAPNQPVSDTDASDDRASTDDALAAVLSLGLAGVASVAIIGALLLLAVGRREPRHATVTPVRSATEVALTRRAARSGGTRAAEDPIVAALGVDEEMAARRAIRRAARRQEEDAEPSGRMPKER